jgi:hypothetical protein
MAKEVALGNKGFALVDDEDYPMVTMYNWHITGDGYASHRVYVAGSYKLLYLHRFIARPRSGYMVDHINGDKLDNRRCNLRCVLQSENSQNQIRKGKFSSFFKGVCFDQNAKKYRADIRKEYKRTSLGVYEDPIDAALAYDVAALELYGPDALTNERLLKQMLETFQKRKYEKK